MREALAASLAGLDGVQVSAYVLANPTPPCIHLYPGGPAGEIIYDLAFQRGLDTWPFTVEAFVGLTADIGSQVKLDQLLDPSGNQSVKQLVEADETLGGVVTNVQVISFTGYRPVALEGRGPLLAAEWHVQILATGH
jgi:hypothetical protein